MVNNARKKLCFVINTLYGGGAERVISNLAGYCNNKGFEVTIICLNEACTTYRLSADIKIISLITHKRKHYFLYRLAYAGLTFIRLLRLLWKEKPHCVIAFMTSANLWAGATCNLLNIPYLVSERITPDYTINRFNSILNYFAAVVYQKAKATVVPSAGMISAFRKNKRFSKLNNFKVIHNPVHQFKPYTKTKVHPRKFILSAGRLDHQKGFDLLIIAFGQLAIPGIDLLISGEGKERETLEKLISSLGLSHRIKLIGFKDSLQDYYRQAELFVLSSRNEGYPNVLVEAMSHGCACIATDCEYGPAEIIEHKKNGILVKPESSIHLAEAIKNIFNDPMLKAGLAENAKLINTTNSLENTAEKWEQLILGHS